MASKRGQRECNDSLDWLHKLAEDVRVEVVPEGEGWATCQQMQQVLNFSNARVREIADDFVAKGKWERKRFKPGAEGYPTYHYRPLK